MIRKRAATLAGVLALAAPLVWAQSMEERLFPTEDTASTQSGAAGDVPTVSELEEMVDLPPEVRLGRESDERLDQPNSLFDNESVRREILGDEPEVIYIPEGIDPMIIPWVRNEIVARELLGDAERLFQEARAEGAVIKARQAIQVLEGISSSYGETPQSREAQRMVSRVRGLVEELTYVPPTNTAGATDPTPVPVQEPINVDLPEWVEVNTRGALYNADDPSASIVLLGDFILGVDEPVPPYPAVTVKEIYPSRVVYTYSDRDFTIPIVTE